MMIDELCTSFNMGEHCDIFPRSVIFSHVKYARRHDVEVAGVERKLVLEISDDEPIMAELVERSAKVRLNPKQERLSVG
jgi:hypothetical protein